jgi:hypothetical protein
MTTLDLDGNQIGDDRVKRDRKERERSVKEERMERGRRVKRERMESESKMEGERKKSEKRAKERGEYRLKNRL